MAADNFGLRIGLEGEKEFKKALADINASFKVLGSEMKLVASQFDKNDKSVEALTSRNAVLNIVEFFNSHHPDPNDPESAQELDDQFPEGMFRFEKRMK